MIIGLTGYKQSGKDTTANILVEEFGFERMAFGDALRQMAYALDVDLYIAEQKQYMAYQRLIDELGYERAKQYPEVRAFLQRLGTEAVRNVLGEQTWINAIYNRLKQHRAKQLERVVITDVRFPNEADFVHLEGGVLWRIIRDEAKTTDAHPSERLVDSLQADTIINNTGTIEQLKAIVRVAYTYELKEPIRR